MGRPWQELYAINRVEDVSRERQKGTKAETDIVNFLNDEGIGAIRHPLSGAKDKGDIFLLELPVTIEVKDHKQMKLAEWIGEATAERINAGNDIGVVWHKRARKGSPGEWYVTMSGADFITVLKKLLD